MNSKHRQKKCKRNRQTLSKDRADIEKVDKLSTNRADVEKADKL